MLNLTLPVAFIVDVNQEEKLLPLLLWMVVSFVVGVDMEKYCLYWCYEIPNNILVLQSTIWKKGCTLVPHIDKSKILSVAS